MAAGGFSAGSLVAQLAAPPGLAAAELVLYKLAQQVAIDADSKSTGFGTTHRAANVNFYQMFKQLDLDQNGGVSKDEFTKTVRRALGVKTSALSDDELNQVFDAIDTSDDGAISFREFSAFAKGAAYSTQLRHAADSVLQLGGGAGGGKSKSSDKNALVGAQPNTLGPTSVEAGGGGVLTYGTPDHPELLKEGPHLSDKLALAGGDQGPEGLVKVHLVLWHLSQHVAKAEEAKSGGGSSNFNAKTSATHPANVSYAKLFKQLDLDNSTLVTRDEWAVTLRRHIGVGKRVSDADLDQIFNEIDQDNSGSISLCEFAAFARGASDSAAMRGVAHELQHARAALRSAKKAQSAFGAPRAKTNEAIKASAAVPAGKFKPAEPILTPAAVVGAPQEAAKVLLPGEEAAKILVESPVEVPSAVVAEPRKDNESPLEVSAEVAVAMAALWDALPKGDDGTVPWVDCWERLLVDDDVARALVINSVESKDDGDALGEGRKLLAAVEYLQSYQKTSDSAVDQASFLRFLSSAEVAAARAHVELQAYAPSADLTRIVEEFWAALPIESIPVSIEEDGDNGGGDSDTSAENSDSNKGRIERLECWKLIMANNELAVALGNGDGNRGQA